ncbi:hypothetical protein AK95_14660 [Paenibacillus sp. LC231]|uniref:helix-turn-helix domain-containing protein n=1 Tax=Paenibacillus sp. LC231 TaxID=1120679 RepID=UPI0008DCEFB8|nr:helix-turn-helix domain-containing protein [Paenibacillus sp. LC231]OIB04854.1 hypothetical protein AK95_14660 [Paenibacillus sp. LC231]
MKCEDYLKQLEQLNKLLEDIPEAQTVNDAWKEWRMLVSLSKKIKTRKQKLSEVKRSNRRPVMPSLGYRPRDPDRIEKMITLFKQGHTHQEIADKFSVSRQYVQQTLRKTGLDGSMGGAAVKPKINSGQHCRVDGCNQKAKTKGFCVMHYSRLRVYGTLEPVFKREFLHHDDKCMVEGCNQPFKTNGLCNKHATNMFLNKKNGNISDLNDYLKVQKAKSMMGVGRTPVKFEVIRKFMAENKDHFIEDLYVQGFHEGR